jgi:hypothetical protein
LVLPKVIVNSLSMNGFVLLSQSQYSFFQGTLVTTMLKKKSKPDFKPPVPFVPGKEKDNSNCYKSLDVKLQHAADSTAIPNPTTEHLPFFYQGKTEQFSSGYQPSSQSWLDIPLESDTLLHSLKGTNNDCWQREVNSAAFNI